MGDDSVKTGVDGLIDLLKKTDKISLSDAAKELEVSDETLKQWAEFLVEEKIIGIEYKFTKPFLYLNKPKEKKKTQIIGEKKLGLETFKEEFYERAKKSSIPKDEINPLWEDHLKNQLEAKKTFFLRESKKRNLKDAKILWQEFQEKIKSEI